MYFEKFSYDNLTSRKSKPTFNGLFAQLGKSMFYLFLFSCFYVCCGSQYAPAKLFVSGEVSGESFNFFLIFE